MTLPKGIGARLGARAGRLVKPRLARPRKFLAEPACIRADRWGRAFHLIIFLRLAASRKNFMTSLRRHESDAEQAGLTLHAACGDVLKSLRRCMRSHNLPGDPFALPTLGRRAEPCLRRGSHLHKAGSS